MAPPTVITMMVGMLAMALAPLVLCDTVCQPGAQLTFILQLPTAGNQPTAFTNATLTNAVSGVVSASGFPSGINNIQIANTTSCNVTTCGTGNNYLAAVSFNYGAGTSFNNTATAAQRAFSSGAFQNNLDNVQGQQGLQLLGLPEVMELCTGTVITGPSLLSLTAAAPGSSFLNNGLPTIFIAFTVSAPNTTKATKATTGTTVANAISGVISSFGGYGLNNPSVVAFTNCTLCTPASANLSDYTLTMTFAYSPGLSFTGLSKLFYTAFNASAFQGNLNNLDSSLTLVAITQILDYDNPSTYVIKPAPPPPPAYLSERLLFNAEQLANIDWVANFVATHLYIYTSQGGFYFTYYDASGYHELLIPFVEPTPDIISLPHDTGSEIAELWQVDFEIQGFTTQYGQPYMVHNTTAQLQTLVLALAASFKAQGLFVVPENVKLFDFWYYKLGLANAPTRRLQQQTGEKLAVCPSGAVCSASVSIAFPQGDEMDPADFAQALFNITSSGILQGAVQLLSNQTWLLQPLAITTTSAAALAYSPPPASVAPPPPPMTGRQITAVYRIAKSLSSSELTIFKAALAQTLQSYGVVSSYITIGTPTPVAGRRLLQAGSVSYDYPVTIQVPGTTTVSALETYLQSDAGQSALTAAITSNGGSFTASVQSVTDTSSGSDASTTACKKHFGHWCIDNSHVSRGGIIAIIVCVGFFVLCLLVLVSLAVLSARRRRRLVKP